MLVRLILMGSISVMPIVFMAGAVLGKQHIKKMAREGGEEKYPQFIKEAVETYRDEHKYYLQEYPWNND